MYVHCKNHTTPLSAIRGQKWDSSNVKMHVQSAVTTEGLKGRKWKESEKLLQGSRICKSVIFNPLTPNDPYRGRTAPLTSKRCILYIYSTNKGTEYFKHGVYSPFLSLQNAVCFIILMYLVPVLFTFYIFIQQIQVLNILNMVYTLRFFSSKCSLFHNSKVFGSCIIHILCTGCAKIKKI